MLLAEVANAHQGSHQVALSLALQALQAGAEAVKFQMYTAEELLTPQHPRYQHFKDQAFSAEQWAYIFEGLEQYSADQIYCDIFGESSLELAISYGVKNIKIHTSDVSNQPLLWKVREHPWERILISAGGCTGFELRAAIDLIGESGEIVLMHGFQAYPTKPEDANLNRIIWLRETFGDVAKVGYQDHTDADTDDATLLPLLAVALGAEIIEKHVTMDRALKGVDYYSSFEPNELVRLVSEISRVKQITGHKKINMSESERSYRDTVKKSWVSNSVMSPGQIVSTQDISLRRTPEKATSLRYEQIVGAIAEEVIGVDEPISLRSLDHKVVALVVARSQSSRLPYKASLPLGNTTTLGHLFRRVLQCQEIDEVVLCTTKRPEDYSLCQLALRNKVRYHRGETDDVLSRMLSSVQPAERMTVIRITGDDTLIDPGYLDNAIRQHIHSGADYTDMKSLPSGFEAELFSYSCLRKIQEQCSDTSGTEYLTYYILDNQEHFMVESFEVPSEHAKSYRFTLDTPIDYENIYAFVNDMCAKGKEFTYSLQDLVEYVEAKPELITSFDKSKSIAQKKVSVTTSLLI